MKIIINERNSKGSSKSIQKETKEMLILFKKMQHEIHELKKELKEQRELLDLNTSYKQNSTDKWMQEQINKQPLNTHIRYDEFSDDFSDESSYIEPNILNTFDLKYEEITDENSEINSFDENYKSNSVSDINSGINSINNNPNVSLASEIQLDIQELPDPPVIAPVVKIVTHKEEPNANLEEEYEEEEEEEEKLEEEEEEEKLEEEEEKLEEEEEKLEEEEEEKEEEEEELEEIQINDVFYYVGSTSNIIYNINEQGDPDDRVGILNDEDEPIFDK